MDIVPADDGRTARLILSHVVIDARASDPSKVFGNLS